MTSPLTPRIGQQVEQVQAPITAPTQHDNVSPRIQDIVNRLQQKIADPSTSGTQLPNRDTTVVEIGQGGHVRKMAQLFETLARRQAHPKQANEENDASHPELATPQLVDAEQPAVRTPSHALTASIGASVKHEEPIRAHEMPQSKEAATPATQRLSEEQADKVLERFKKERLEERNLIGSLGVVKKTVESWPIASMGIVPNALQTQQETQEPEANAAQSNTLLELKKFSGLSPEDLGSSTLEKLVPIFSQQVPAGTRRELCLEILNGQHPELSDTLTEALLKSYPKPESAAAFQSEVIEGTGAILKQLGAHQTPNAIDKTMKQFQYYIETMSKLISREEMTHAQKQLNFPVQYFYTIQAEAQVLQKMVAKEMLQSEPNLKILNDKLHQVNGLTSWWNFQLEWLTSHPTAKYSSTERIAAMHSFLSEDPTNLARLNICLSQMLQFLGAGERLYRNQKGFISNIREQDEPRDAAYLADCLLSTMSLIEEPAEQMIFCAFAQTLSRPDIQAIAAQTQDKTLIQAFKLLSDNPLFEHPMRSARRHISLVKPAIESMNAFVQNKKPFNYVLESGKNKRIAELDSELKPLLDVLQDPIASKDFVHVLGTERTNEFIGQLEKFKVKINFAEYQSKPKDNTTRQIREACDTTCQELINALKAARA